jgi:two-component system sensor histidine kinase DesK
MRVLPKNHFLGWTPYAWLVYLCFFFMQPIYSHAGVREWAITITATVVFLLLYFRGFWLCDWSLVLNTAGIALLGVLLTPHNPGAVGFFIYASAFLGFAGETNFAVKLLVALLAIISLEAWISHFSLGTWLTGAVFVLIVGGVNIHFAQAKRADQKLRMAQKEVEHLAKVAERERIARDLHDVLGHTLSVIVLKSELASKLIERDPERAKNEIRDVENISRDALADVRHAIRGYRAKGLSEEMARARATLETAGVRFDCEAKEIGLSPAQESVLALVMREAVTNVVRHAEARTCKVELQRVNGDCMLQIEDDGRGGIQIEGNGIRGMRERIEALGGHVERSTGQGTRLKITLPLKAEESRA